LTVLCSFIHLHSIHLHFTHALHSAFTLYRDELRLLNAAAAAAPSARVRVWLWALFTSPFAWLFAAAAAAVVVVARAAIIDGALSVKCLAATLRYATATAAGAGGGGGGGGGSSSGSSGWRVSSPFTPRTVRRRDEMP
jgi:uncharacterized membrane protein YgcG